MAAGTVIDVYCERPGIRALGPFSVQISVTAVIPTHARDDLLRQALASALDQSADLVEVVVVDDVGSDATRRVVESVRHGDVEVRYVHNRAGNGASSSRNLGAQEAKGSHVAFLDDDDEWLPGYVQHAVAQVRATGRSVVFTQLDRFLEAGRPLPEDLTSQEVIATNPGVSGSSIVMGRDAFLRLGGFDPAMWVSNDKDFLVRLLDSGATYAVVAEPLVHWRQHVASRLTRPSQRRLDGLQAYYTKYEARLTRRDRRKLLGVISNTRRHLAPRATARAGHLTLAVLRLGPTPFARRLLGRQRQRTARLAMR